MLIAVLLPAAGGCRKRSGAGEGGEVRAGIRYLGVFGIPHVVLLEPDGYVVWEGFPLLKDYELTDEIIERVLSVGRGKQQADSGDGG